MQPQALELVLGGAAADDHVCRAGVAHHRRVELAIEEGRLPHVDGPRHVLRQAEGVLDPDADRQLGVTPVEAERVEPGTGHRRGLDPPLVEVAPHRGADVTAGERDQRRGGREAAGRAAHRIPRARPTESETRLTPCAWENPRCSSSSVVKRWRS